MVPNTHKFALSRTRQARADDLRAETRAAVSGACSVLSRCVYSFSPRPSELVQTMDRRCLSSLHATQHINTHPAILPLPCHCPPEGNAAQPPICEAAVAYLPPRAVCLHSYHRMSGGARRQLARARGACQPTSHLVEWIANKGAKGGDGQQQRRPPNPHPPPCTDLRVLPPRLVTSPKQSYLQGVLLAVGLPRHVPRRIVFLILTCECFDYQEQPGGVLACFRCARFRSRSKIHCAHLS